MLAQEKITISKDSSSQEDFKEDESLNDKKFKSKKQDSLIVDSYPVKNKVPEQLEDIGRKESLSAQQVYTRKYHSVMLESCTGKRKIAEPSIQCNFEGVESPDIPVTVTEQQQEDDEDIFKKLNIPWVSEGVPSLQEGKCLDSENENLRKSIQQYKYQIDFLHETNEGLVVENRILREDLEEINSHYQELIVVSKEAAKDI